jgi:hypothetical protein
MVCFSRQLQESGTSSEDLVERTIPGYFVLEMADSHDRSRLPTFHNHSPFIQQDVILTSPSQDFISFHNEPSI